MVDMNMQVNMAAGFLQHFPVQTQLNSKGHNMAAAFLQHFTQQTQLNRKGHK